jgi:hypothetical protein
MRLGFERGASPADVARSIFDFSPRRERAFAALFAAAIAWSTPGMAAEPGGPTEPTAGRYPASPVPQIADNEIRQIVQAARRAVEACDKAEFDRAKAKLKNAIDRRLGDRTRRLPRAVEDTISSANMYMAQLERELADCAKLAVVVSSGRYILTFASDTIVITAYDQEAIATARRCDRAAYRTIMHNAQRRSQENEERAKQHRVSADRFRAAGDIRTAQEQDKRAREAENDAAVWWDFHQHLLRSEKNRFKHCGPEKKPDSSLPKTRSGPQVAMGGHFGNVNVPGFGAGTQFNVALGREVPILFSPRNLTFAGGAAEFRAPVSSVFGADVPSIFSQMAFYAKLEGYSFWGSESGSVPFGGNNVAYTNIFANPATGTTGVLAGATGQDVSIKANGEAIKFRAGAEWQVSLAELQTFYAVITGGAAFDYTDSGYEITQQSLFFSDVSSRTKLRVDDYFFAPYIGAGVRFDDGNVFASVSGFVAPGVLFTDASAKQKNLCGPCPNPGDRNFKLSTSFSNTRFAVQTGVDLKLGARLTPSVAIEGGFHYVHTSHAGYLRLPTTPNEQPIRLEYGSSNRFGGQISVKYTF